MAEKRVIELEIDASKVEKSLAELNADFKSVKQSVDSIEKSSKETSDKASKGFKGLEGSVKKVGKSIKGIGLAFKAIGIGLVLQAFTAFQQVLSENQRFADGFQIAMGTLSNVLNDVVNFLIDSIEPVTGFFKSLLQDPIGNLKNFGRAIIENVIERVNSALEVLGFLGEAVVKVFKGDFSGALESVKEAGKEVVDVVTGVDDTTQKVGDTLTKTAEAVTEYAKSTFEGAKAEVALANAATLAAAEQEKLRIENLKAAEEQRQIRDDISEDIEVRIKANEELGKILEEGILQEKQLAEIQLASAEAALANNSSNIQLQADLISAQAAVLEIEERLGGQRSEQLVNEIALEQEKLDLIVANNEQASNLRQIELQGAIETEKSLFARFELEKQLLDEQLALAELNLEKTSEIFGEETLQFKNALKARDEAKAQSEAAQTAITIAEEDARREIGLTTLAMITQAAGKQSVLGKAAAIAQTIINTKEAVTNALKGAPVPFNFALAAATAAFGAKQVADIISTKVPGETMGMSGSVGGAQGTVPETTAPDFNVVGASPINQLAQSLNNQEPQRAFVVSGDVTTAQELDRNIITDSVI